ncbi:DNA polymerase kappa [Populus alba x Populus x berolinensis]|nr:DNA polymerase kappa [Populus alba x Populus x berolinensis]
MPGFIARKLCPELIFVPIDFKKYTHYSELTRKVFEKYDPNFMAASLDEAYLDITEVCKERGMSCGEIAEELRKCINEETGLTCSAGVAPNRLLAKVCSDINKPNGQFVLINDRMAVMTFISSLPIRKIGGIGKVTEHILRDAFGISTCEEMLQKGGLLCALFSHSTADFFLSVSLGIGKTDTPQVRSRKSISSERTFSATDDETLLYQKLADIAEMLCADMKKGGLCGRTLTLKLKTASFEVRSRAVTLEKYICSSEDILKYASKLLKAELPISLRLMGLRLSHFNEDNIGAPSDPTQKTLNNFIVPGDLSRKNLDDPKSLGLDINDQHLMNNMEGSFSIESHELQHYGIRDPLDSNNLQDLNVHHCTYTDSVEAEKIHEPSSNKIADKVITKDMAGEVSQRKESGLSLPGQLEGGSPDRMNRVIMDNEAVFSSEQKDGLVWVDDYKCSLCGIEMPPYFDEERQEHSDFHLAERLQKDESRMDSRTSTPRQRSVQKDHISSQSKRKKRKPSPKEGGHLSIDMFFARSNQNF